MHLETEDLSPVLKRVRVTVPRAVVDAGFSSTYNQFSRQAAVPGFRRGHVPRAVVVKRFLKQATAEVTQDLVQKSWKKTLDDFELVPVAQPMLEGGQVKEGADFSFSFLVEVAPKVELRPYSDFEVEATTWTIGDDVLEHELTHVAEQVATFKPVTDRDVVAQGDQIVFDFVGSLDGQPFPGGADQKAELEIGSNRFIPGFEAQVIGQKVGEDFHINVTFPADYNAPDLAGRETRFDCHIHEIRAKHVPAVGPELALAMNEPDLDTVRVKLRERMLTHFQDRSKREAKESLQNQIVALYSFELPPSLVEQEVETSARQLYQRMVEEQKLSGDQALAILTSQREQLQANVSNALRRRFVLDAVAEKVGIEVEAAEVTAHIEEMARSMGRYGNQMRMAYRDANQRSRLKLQMRDDRVLDFLLEHATKNAVERSAPAHKHDEEAAPPEATQGAAE